MTKRWPSPVAKPGQIKIQYGRDMDSKDVDLQFCYGGEGATKREVNMMIYAFYKMKGLDGKSIIESLEECGYDITTIKFTIEKKVLPISENKEPE